MGTASMVCGAQSTHTQECIERVGGGFDFQDVSAPGVQLQEHLHWRTTPPKGSQETADSLVRFLSYHRQYHQLGAVNGVWFGQTRGVIWSHKVVNAHHISDLMIPQ